MEKITETENITKTEKAPDTVQEKEEVLAAKEPKMTFYVQYRGKEISGTELAGKIRECYEKEADEIKEVKEMDYYIKPEENKVYYVVNGEHRGCIAI